MQLRYVGSVCRGDDYFIPNVYLYKKIHFDFEMFFFAFQPKQGNLFLYFM